MLQHPDFNKNGLHHFSGMYFGPLSEYYKNDPEESLYWCVRGTVMNVGPSSVIDWGTNFNYKGRYKIPDWL